MTTAKHTPWEVSPHPWPEQIGCCPLIGRPYSIHGADWHNVAAATTIEIARLIAAAPDLLAVAKECIDLVKLAESLCGCRGDDDYVWGIQERLNAAIAKAEGRP